jgi:type IV pilus assembly protein PilA
VLLLALIACVGLAGCSPKASEAPPPPPQVPPEGRSAVSAAVAAHLEYGGEFFAVFDIQGDLEQLGNQYATLIAAFARQYPGNPNPNLDYHPLFQQLGLYGIAGGGLSSWHAPGDVLHHNRAFLYVPDGRQGILQVFGGAPIPFITPSLAPADADLTAESTINLKALADLILGYINAVGGPDQLALAMARLKQPVAPNTTVTWLWLLQHLDTRVTLIARADPAQTLPLPNGLTIPQIDLLIGLDGFADLFTQLQPLLAVLGTVGEKNALKTATLGFPLPGAYANYQPELLADPKTGCLYLVSRPAFADATVFAQGPRLATSGDFLAATAGLPSTGNGFSYISKKGIDAAIKVYNQSLAQLPPSSRQAVDQVYGYLAHLPHGIASAQVNLPDGILALSVAPQSNKAVLLAGPFVGIGLMSAMAIPAFNKVRLQSREKAVTNNLRQLASAGQQYMLDKGVTSASYSDLVGDGTNKYIRSITPVAGENYQDISIYQTTTQISVSSSGIGTVTYNL